MNKFNDQVNFWAHMLDEAMNEDVERISDGYFTQVTDNGKWLCAKHIIEILDNLPDGAYQNPLVAASLPAQIFGYVNGVSEQISKSGKKYVQLTIAPYVNGSKRRDFSAGSVGEPLNADKLKQALSAVDQDCVALVKQKDWRNGSDVVLVPFESIEASRSDGVFLRLGTPCETLEDNVSKSADFATRIAQQMKARYQQRR